MPNNPVTAQTPDDVTAPAGNSAATAPRSQTVHAAKPRTHVVAGGETLAGIARKAGVSLAALQAANPGVTPKKLRVGQTVNLPEQ